jgi:beta-lactamase superfamily II metal-dependent hydrolase
MAIDLGGSARLEVLSSGESGLTLSLVDYRARFLLPLGADPDSIDSLVRSGEAIQAQVLVAADSGYAAVNPPGLFERVRPQLVVLAVEADDPRGLPSPEVLSALQGVTVLRTDRHGWVEFRTDGERLWVEVERPEAPD